MRDEKGPSSLLDLVGKRASELNEAAKKLVGVATTGDAENASESNTSTSASTQSGQQEGAEGTKAQSRSLGEEPQKEEETQQDLAALLIQKLREQFDRIVGNLLPKAEIDSRWNTLVGNAKNDPMTLGNGLSSFEATQRAEDNVARQKAHEVAMYFSSKKDIIKDHAQLVGATLGPAPVNEQENIIAKAGQLIRPFFTSSDKMPSDKPLSGHGLTVAKPLGKEEGLSRLT